MKQSLEKANQKKGLGLIMLPITPKVYRCIETPSPVMQIRHLHHSQLSSRGQVLHSSAAGPGGIVLPFGGDHGPRSVEGQVQQDDHRDRCSIQQNTQWNGSYNFNVMALASGRQESAKQACCTILCKSIPVSREQQHNLSHCR